MTLTWKLTHFLAPKSAVWQPCTTCRPVGGKKNLSGKKEPVQNNWVNSLRNEQLLKKVLFNSVLDFSVFLYSVDYSN